MKADGHLSIALEAVDLAVDLFTDSATGCLTAKGERDYASEVDYAIEDRIRSFRPPVPLHPVHSGSGLGRHCNGKVVHVSGVEQLADALVAIGDCAVGERAEGRPG